MQRAPREITLSLRKINFNSCNWLICAARLIFLLLGWFLPVSYILHRSKDQPMLTSWLLRENLNCINYLILSLMKIWIIKILFKKELLNKFYFNRNKIYFPSNRKIGSNSLYLLVNVCMKEVKLYNFKETKKTSGHIFHKILNLIELYNFNPLGKI